jgi:two-component system response regulator MprA
MHEPSSRVHHHHTSKQHGAPRVLLVDDDKLAHRIVGNFLEANCFVVHSVFDGRAALAAVRSFAPDLLILDVVLPGENGYRVSRAIKMLASSVPGLKTPKIVLATARSLAGDAEREETMLGYSMADAMLYKPLDLDQLLAKLQELTRERRPAGVS